MALLATVSSQTSNCTQASCKAAILQISKAKSTWHAGAWELCKGQPRTGKTRLTSQEQRAGILLWGVAGQIMKQADELHVLDLEVWQQSRQNRPPQWCTTPLDRPLLSIGTTLIIVLDCLEQSR